MKKPVITIIDYGVGNLISISNAISYLGYQSINISSDFHEIINSDALILPGVGAFAPAMQNLRNLGLDHVLNEVVLEARKPILGICLGMQLMADTSEENGLNNGLGWIPGNVVKLNIPEKFVVPHVGWNNIQILKKSPLFKNDNQQLDFYFDHSYHYKCEEKYIISECNYSCSITSAIAYKNIYGVQFHPEKSQNNGLRLFRSFFNMVAQC